MSQFIVGLTGGIGSGKSTVGKMFEQKGIEVIDADQIARIVVEPGTQALLQIKQHFGEQVLNEDGSLNRAQLRSIIFANSEEKHWLNQLLHPIIRQKMIDACTHARSAYVILMVPLLIENNLIPLVHKLLVVDVAPEIQIQRTILRDNVDETQVKNIIASQASRELRLQLADDIILNHGDSTELNEQINALHQHYLQQAKIHAKA
ncbi:dephospho-CoA kinase [Neptunicella marina]|uniref:Dephospho-CoA kinase n=1 Tax=Neptunicella marina TaxID=2125989 RepID=A0A8J6IT78_9ALTE|nr:dephospho-CoA kinase [Neptunicella marina]MBC3765312.1 dephospho-CoA kinase [Neptunicella marina]